MTCAKALWQNHRELVGRRGLGRSKGSVYTADEEAAACWIVQVPNNQIL